MLKIAKKWQKMAKNDKNSQNWQKIAKNSKKLLL